MPSWWRGISASHDRIIAPWAADQAGRLDTTVRSAGEVQLGRPVHLHVCAHAGVFPRRRLLVPVLARRRYGFPHRLQRALAQRSSPAGDVRSSGLSADSAVELLAARAARHWPDPRRCAVRSAAGQRCSGFQRGLDNSHPSRARALTAARNGNRHGVHVPASRPHTRLAYRRAGRFPVCLLGRHGDANANHADGTPIGWAVHDRGPHAARLGKTWTVAVAAGGRRYRQRAVRTRHAEQGAGVVFDLRPARTVAAVRSNPSATVTARILAEAPDGVAGARGCGSDCASDGVSRQGHHHDRADRSQCRRAAEIAWDQRRDLLGRPQLSGWRSE